ncbi:MAG: AsmA family protein [Candidatus Lustribacter sp.]|jgi:hypothetical protein
MARPRFGSKPVRIVAAAVLLLVLAALAVPFLIPVDNYRPLLVWAVESATGREVQIDALKLSLLPTVHITVVNFRMKNPPGFPAGDALVASSIDLGIAPQALLSRRVDVTYIAPSGVQLNVLRNAAGRTNFATTAPASTPAQKPAPVFSLEPIGAVTVKDAAITFGDALGKALPAPTFALRGVNGTIGSIDPQASDWVKKLNIVADLRGTQLTLSNLTKPIDFHSGELTIKSEAARGTFSLSVGSIDLAGAAAFARLDPLLITFAVSGPELDFNTLATFLVGAHGSAGPAATRRLLAHGTVAIGKVVFAPLAASRLKGQLDLYTSAVRLNAWTLSAYGGTVRGNAELTGSAGSPLAVTAQARGLNVAQVLAAVGSGSGGVTGALSTNFRLTTLLTRDPEQSLKTTGTFVVRNGSFPSIAFKGVTLPAADSRFSSLGGDLRIAQERGYSNALTLLGPEMQATSHGSFGFDKTLQYSGTAVVNPLTQGTSLAGPSLVATLQPLLASVLPKNAGAARMRLPFTLRGTLNSPQFALAGTPQLIMPQGSGQAPQLPTTMPSIQDLEKLIPGL